MFFKNLENEQFKNLKLILKKRKTERKKERQKERQKERKKISNTSINLIM
jgi:hypothetical protein